MIRKLKEYSEKYSGRWVTGVSGGSDSMSLLHGLVMLGLKPVVAHVNYGKRIPDSDLDENLVRQYCLNNGLLFFCKKTDLPIEGNFQNAARKLRYEWFEKVRIQTESKWIATAHHSDDQIETLIFRLLRKCSLGELTGIQQEKGCIIRPLLTVSKKSVDRFVHKHNIPFRTDESNYDLSYDRNMIRHKVIPALDQEFNDWREQIAELPVLAHYYHQCIREAAEPFISEHGLNTEYMRQLPQEFHKDILSYYIRRETDDSATRGFLENVTKLQNIQTGRVISVNSDFDLVKNRAHLLLQPRDKITAKESIIEGSEIPVSVKAGIYKLSFNFGIWQGKPQQNTLEMDVSELLFPLKIREWRDGDKIQPLGMKGHKLVSDLLTDKKVSASLKRNSLVTETFDGKICAVIFGVNPEGVISRKVKCHKKTRKTLMIKWNTDT
jgi:tRNA(Ile)-lysidine synthase